MDDCTDRVDQLLRHVPNHVYLDADNVLINVPFKLLSNELKGTIRWQLTGDTLGRVVASLQIKWADDILNLSFPIYDRWKKLLECIINTGIIYLTSDLKTTMSIPVDPIPQDFVPWKATWTHSQSPSPPNVSLIPAPDHVQITNIVEVTDYRPSQQGVVLSIATNRLIQALLKNSEVVQEWTMIYNHTRFLLVLEIIVGSLAYRFLFDLENPDHAGMAGLLCFKPSLVLHSPLIEQPMPIAVKPPVFLKEYLLQRDTELSIALAERL